MVKNHYWLLTTVCNVGKIGAVLLLIYGIGSVFFAAASYTPSAIMIGTALGSYITCEGVLVLVAIERQLRANARLLRGAHNDYPEEDEG
jgi:hypothetical protein